MHAEAELLDRRAVLIGQDPHGLVQIGARPGNGIEDGTLRDLHELVARGFLPRLAGVDHAEVPGVSARHPPAAEDRLLDRLRHQIVGRSDGLVFGRRQRSGRGQPRTDLPRRNIPRRVVGRVVGRIVRRGAFHQHLAEIVVRRRVARGERDLHDGVVRRRNGKRAEDAGVQGRVFIDDQSARGAGGIDAGDISGGLNLQNRVLARRQAGELIVSVGVGRGRDLVAAGIQQRHAAGVAQFQRHARKPRVVGRELAVADGRNIGRRFSLLEHDGGAVLEHVAGDRGRDNLPEVVAHPVDRPGPIGLAGCGRVRRVGRRPSRRRRRPRDSPRAALPRRRRRPASRSVNAYLPFSSVVVEATRLPEPSKQVDGHSAQERLAGIERVVAVVVDEHLAADAGRQQFAEIIVPWPSRRWPAGWHRSSRRGYGPPRRALPAVSSPSRYPSGCVSATPYVPGIRLSK